MDGWMDGWMDIWIDGWMDGWMDVCLCDGLFVILRKLSFT
jgi:hypothetical protein